MQLGVQRKGENKGSVYVVDLKLLRRLHNSISLKVTK